METTKYMYNTKKRVERKRTNGTNERRQRRRRIQTFIPCLRSTPGTITVGGRAGVRPPCSAGATVEQYSLGLLGLGLGRGVTAAEAAPLWCFSYTWAVIAHHVIATIMTRTFTNLIYLVHNFENEVNQVQWLTSSQRLDS